MSRRRLLLLTGILPALVLSATGLPRSVASPPTLAQQRASGPHYTATITRTEGGIPHIVGRTYGDAGFGYGFAFAQDNICTMADDYVTVLGQRSRFFGPDQTYLQRANGVLTRNIDSDLFWTEVQRSHVVKQALARKPPLGPSRQLIQLLHGYVAGYNRYLASIGGAKGVKDPACHGKPWVRPITFTTAALRFYQLLLFASEDVAIPGIAAAAPPAPASPNAAAGAAEGIAHPRLTALRFGERWHKMMGTLGSNAVAVGRQGTRDRKHGLLLGNPHFPWLGTERFYQSQITVPGRMNVAGASLFGVPLILIGHTSTMAWSHTVSTAYRFTPYQLTLDPSDPTSYMYDGKALPMQPRPVTVTERAGGRLRQVRHTLWWTRYGPVFNSLLGIPLPWTNAEAFAMRDANADDFRVFNHFFDTDRAHTTRQEFRILKKYEGIPWVNTIVSDKRGLALYADIGSIPDVSDAKARSCDTALGAATFQLLGLPILDGSRSGCNWAVEKGAIEPGLMPPNKLPHLFRRDYVTNSNDSYWLSNPHHPLTGYARIIGDERTPRSLRTRIGLIMTQHIVSGRRFTLGAMQRMEFSDRQYAGMLTRDDLVSLCRSLGGSAPTSSGGTVSTGDACSVLQKWDLRENLGSRGAILFRRFWDHLDGSTQSTVYNYGHVAPYWSHQFTTNDPVHTPYGLNTSDPEVAQSLGDAISDLRAAHLPLDVSVGKAQGVRRNGRFIPIHGGEGDPNGEFNAIYAPWISGKGLGDVDDGSSYIQVVTWRSGDSCPVARTILTYSESSDPTDPHYADMTKRFSRKQWYVDRFCPMQQRQDRHRTVQVVTG